MFDIFFPPGKALAREIAAIGKQTITPEVRGTVWSYGKKIEKAAKEKLAQVLGGKARLSSEVSESVRTYWKGKGKYVAARSELFSKIRVGLNYGGTFSKYISQKPKVSVRQAYIYNLKGTKDRTTLGGKSTGALDGIWTRSWSVEFGKVHQGDFNRAIERALKRVEQKVNRKK